MSRFKEAIAIMNQRFGKDSLISIATVDVMSASPTFAQLTVCMRMALFML